MGNVIPNHKVQFLPNPSKGKENSVGEEINWNHYFDMTQAAQSYTLHTPLLICSLTKPTLPALKTEKRNSWVPTIWRYEDFLLFHVYFLIIYLFLIYNKATAFVSCWFNCDMRRLCSHLQYICLYVPINNRLSVISLSLQKAFLNLVFLYYAPQAQQMRVKICFDK